MPDLSYAAPKTVATNRPVGPRTREPYDVRTPDGLASIARLREQFMADPRTDLSRLRPNIAQSWRRSAAMQVDPNAGPRIDDQAHIDEQTMRCLAPHIRELEHTAADCGGDVTLTSPGGALVLDATPALKDRYENGRILLESACGTNGEGTALEDGTSGWVHTSEHYREDFSSTACYCALIRDPFRDSIRSCVTLTLPQDVVHASKPGSIALLMSDMASKVSRELAKRSAPREQMLFSEYLKVVRRFRNGAIVATDGKHTTVSDAALELLRQDDFAAICSYAQEALRLRRELTHDVTLSGGRTVRAHISLAGDPVSPLGAIVVVKPRGDDPRGQHMTASGAGRVMSRHSTFDDLIGENTAFQHALDIASGAVERIEPVHLIGDPGVGKRMIALRIADTWSPKVQVYECSQFDEATTAAVEDQIAADGVAILRDADALPIAASQTLADTMRRAKHPKVILTLRRPTQAASILINQLNSVEVALPSLRSRREDVSALATRFIADMTEKKPSARLLFVLSQADWPQNVTQLKSVVEQAAIASRGTEVSVGDLPQSFRGGVTGGSLSRLEEVEVQELRAALEEADGNRSLAADILQIGRSTLYRRLDSYRRRGILI